MPTFHEPTEEFTPDGIAAPAADAGMPLSGPGGAEPSRGEAGAQASEAAFLSEGSELREGRYVLDRVLGRGGMAAVWLGRDRRLERPVAIKVLSDTLAGERDYLARFRREARVAAGLTHPNLTRIYDFGDEGGRPFLVMEYVSGGDLAKQLADGRAPDPERLARELLSALRHIHRAGVLHRDVKAQNVLIGSDGGARLTDFGIAQPADATSLTQTGVVIGTARYIAPEVLSGAPPSERSDLYSLGVLLAGVIAQEPGDRALGQLVEALHSKDPADRPESAEAALAELASTQPSTLEPTAPIAAATRRNGDSGPDAVAEPSATHRKRPIAPRAALAGAIAGVAALVLAIGVLATGGGGEEGAETAGTSGPAQEASAGDEEGGGGGGEANGGGGENGQAEADAPTTAEGFELNDRGFQLINAGDPDDAIPLLRRAVEALRDSGDITYAYALFNLGQALRLAGHPEEAITILEARLEIPNQRGIVRRELEAARAEAGQDDGHPGRGRADDD